MRKLNVGAIGCGYWGPNFIRNFIEIPEADLRAIADLDQGQLDHLQTRYPSIEIATKDYRDFFALGLDAVVISTPPETHFSIAQECLLHGLHVLVEKPLTINSHQARELITLAEKHDRVLMVGHLFEYNSSVHTLKKIIESGELGDIFYIDAVRASLGLFHPTLNVIWDLAPHDISILNYLLGDVPLNVSARGSACVHRAVEDVAYVTLMYPNNLLAHLRLSWLDPHKTRRITVVGNKKMAVFDDVESLEKVRVYNKGVKAIRRTDTYGEFQFAYHYGDVVSPYIHFEEPLHSECLHFLECVRQRKKPLTDGYNGLRVVNVIEAAQRSLKNGGRAVPIEPTPVHMLNGHPSSKAVTNGIYIGG
ncbi:MAG: Gfo/Idh/MocA family oxidoreductase [Anaerolineae bacterium]|nr:Gfo/Idh/MocA family oxidoreductase [Anaerolineae bacterium]